MNKSDILELLLHTPMEYLRQKASASTFFNRGKHVFTRGLIEFSNICKRNCLYCGLRQQNKNIRRYRLNQKEILNQAAQAVSQGIDTIVLQSGEGACDAHWLGEIVREIKQTLHVPVTLSVGERESKDYEYWLECGANRYLLKHETADAALYERLHPGYTLGGRIEHLKILASLGYEVGGGFMIGLPGQTVESLADDIALCVDLKLDMCGAGPFVAQHNTPLCKEPQARVDIVLRVLSILRMVLPGANLPATTALATIDRENGQSLGLEFGANVLMPSFTPPEHSRDYVIYDHKNRVAVQDAIKIIESCNRVHGLKKE